MAPGLLVLPCALSIIGGPKRPSVWIGLLGSLVHSSPRSVRYRLKPNGSSNAAVTGIP